MPNKLEKQFFDTFGIEPRSYLVCTSCWDCIDAQPCEQCHYGKLIEDEYPKITDRILLELICIANQHGDYPTSTNIKNIQARTLRILIKTAKLMYKYYSPNGRYKKFVKQVCALFKEALK